MPTSPWSNITPILDLIMDLSPRPTRVLDVGVGCGKFGLLCKEYLGFWNSPDTQRPVVVDGIEAFPAYLGAPQRAIYDSLHVGDAREILPRLPTDAYDLVLLVDVLEHFSRPDGFGILSECRRVGKVFVVSTPREYWPQEDSWGNPYERHQSLWRGHDFRRMGATRVTRAENWLGVFAKTPYAERMTLYYRLWRLGHGFWPAPLLTRAWRTIVSRPS